jgi:outer membrane protein assembly factor BamB
MRRKDRFWGGMSNGSTPGGAGNPRRLALGAAVLMIVAVVVPAVVIVPAVAGANGVSTNWTTYHANRTESGIAPTSASFASPTLAWTSPTLDGELYGEPLVDGNLVVIATENDTVYALNATTGAVSWSAHIGTPVPSSDLPCGNITPTVGITSTPVIDVSRSEVFAVADKLAGTKISHHLIGLDLTTGHVLLNQVVDPAGSLPAAQLQRAALALDLGSVVIGFGGNAGDCSTYHGWVVSVPETGGSPHLWEADASPGHDQGAVWMGGAAPAVGGSGSIWVATGNGSNTSGGSPDGSDSVVELSTTLVPLQSFTPSTWQSDNASDFDLGSSPPALLGNGFVFQVGKSQTAFLLRKSQLGGVGGQVAQAGSFCGADVDGGEAFTSSVVYVPCLAGVTAVRVNPSGATPLRVLWTTDTNSTGPPIVAGNKVWTISRDGTLYGLSEASGQALLHLALGSAPANDFPTPAVGAGLLLAPAFNRVVAFR